MIDPKNRQTQDAEAATRGTGVNPGLPSHPPEGLLTSDQGDLLARYLRRSACATAAGMGAFGLAPSSQGAINVFTPTDTFLQRSLVGNPYYSAPIEDNNNPGAFPFRSVGFATEGFAYQYGGYYQPQNVAFGIDLDFNGSGDINFFRGQGYAGYLNATTKYVGYYPGSGKLPGSGQVQLLSNDTENPDSDFLPLQTGDKQILQGFSAGQIIGDGNDVSLADREGVMRDAYSIGDWDGVNDNYQNLYPAAGGSSYVGFQISGLSTGTGSGFGWVEVIVREGTHAGFTAPSHPELQIIKWAYTDDGAPIAAGDEGPLLQPGDVDCDGDVDTDDLNIVLNFFGSNGTTLKQGDADGDGDTNTDDLNIVLNFFGTGTGPVSAPATVPEPTALGLLAAGAGGLALRRKRKGQ